MDKEQEPILSDMKPSQDDIALRQKQLQARKAAAARAAAARPAVTVAAPAPKQTLAVLALILALALGGLAAFLFMQLQELQQKFANAEHIIVAQSKNIDVLNDKLSVTGENANLSVDALKAILKNQDSEIRKLWDLANKTNRAKIEANGKSIAAVKSSLEKSLEKTNAAADKQQKQIAAAESATGELKKRLARVETRTQGLDEMELRLLQQGESIQALYADLERMKRGGVGADAADIRLQLEDINIRLDRMQAALGTAK